MIENPQNHFIFNFSFWLNFANKKSEQVFSLYLVCKVLETLTWDLQNLYHPNLDNFERPYVICQVLESLGGTLQTLQGPLVLNILAETLWNL